MVAAANLERAGPRLARRLVLDELFDLSLYRSLRDVAPPDLRRVLEQLIPIETRHFRFWQDFFGLLIVAVSALLAFLSGMAMRRRIAMNLVIIAIAVGFTYAIGLATKSLWGVSV